MCGSNDFHYVSSAASDSPSGGLLLAWNRNSFRKEQYFQGSRWIIVKGKIVGSNWNCVIGLIYGDFVIEDRERVYHEITEVKNILQCPCMIIRDFNQVMHFSERKGHTRGSSGIPKFNEWVNSSNFLDLPLKGRKYTWKRGNSRSKIDGCLVEPQWLQTFPLMELVTVENIVSDHLALLLSLSPS